MGEEMTSAGNSLCCAVNYVSACSHMSADVADQTFGALMARQGTGRYLESYTLAVHKCLLEDLLANVKYVLVKQRLAVHPVLYLGKLFKMCKIGRNVAVRQAKLLSIFAVCPRTVFAGPLTAHKWI